MRENGVYEMERQKRLLLTISMNTKLGHRIRKQ